MDLLQRLVAVALVFSALVPVLTLGVQAIARALMGRPFGRHLLAVAVMLVVLLVAAMQAVRWAQQQQVLIAGVLLAGPVWAAAWLLERYVLRARGESPPDR
jgi:uncharacterized membrane protein YidH (DUF202 family)